MIGREEISINSKAYCYRNLLLLHSVLFLLVSNINKGLLCVS
jgi:hypothetical protein